LDIPVFDRYGFRKYYLTDSAGETVVWEAEWPAGVTQWQGEDGGVQCPNMDGTKWIGTHGLQGGDLKQYDYWVWEAWHQRLHLDHAQG